MSSRLDSWGADLDAVGVEAGAPSDVGVEAGAPPVVGVGAGSGFV